MEFCDGPLVEITAEHRNLRTIYLVDLLIYRPINLTDYVIDFVHSPLWLNVNVYDVQHSCSKLMSAKDDVLSENVMVSVLDISLTIKRASSDSTFMVHVPTVACPGILCTM